MFLIKLWWVYKNKLLNGSVYFNKITGRPQIIQKRILFHETTKFIIFGVQIKFTQLWSIGRGFGIIVPPRAYKVTHNESFNLWNITNTINTAFSCTARPLALREPIVHQLKTSAALRRAVIYYFFHLSIQEEPDDRTLKCETWRPARLGMQKLPLSVECVRLIAKQVSRNDACVKFISS